MPTYTVKDDKTGMTVDFMWSGKKPPTDTDISAVFAEAQKQKTITPQNTKSPSPSWGQVASEALGNIPSSALEMGRAMVQPLIHPIETATTMGNIVAGGIERLIPGEQKHEQSFNAMLDMYANRYGGIENFKQTLASDPVGVLSDMATALTAGGGVAKGIGALSKSQKLVKAGTAISKAGTSMEPISIAMKGAALPLRLIPEKIPSKLYQSSAKFATTLTEGQRTKLTQTALKYDITPTIKGVNKTRSMIDNINADIVSKIDAATQTGQQIPIDRLFQDFGDLQKQVLSESGHPIQSAKAVLRIEKEIRKANEVLGRTGLTPMQAQKLKQGIYKELQSYYSSVKESPAAAKAQQTVARAAKEALEEIIPEIKMLNAQEGSLIELHDAIQKSSSRIQNRDILGIGIPLKTGAGGVVAGVPGAAGALALGLLDTPAVKAKIAITLNNLRKKGIKIKPSRAALRLGLFQAGRMKENQEEE